MLLQGFSKLIRNFSCKLSLTKYFLEYYEKISKGFLGKMFLSNWKCKTIFPNPCKNISRKVIRNPFKNISCIIIWNDLAKFCNIFDTVWTSWKSTLRNFTARFFKASPKFFWQTFSKEALRKGFKKISWKDFFI